MKKLKFTILVVLLLSIFVQLAPGQVVNASSENNMITNENLQQLDKNNADKPTDDNPTVSTSGNNSEQTVGLTAFDYIKALFYFGLVLAILIYVLRFINKRSVKYQQNSIVQNLGGTSLGAQKSVQLLRIGDTIYIVGIGDNVQLIKEISDPEEVEEIINEYNERLTLTTGAPKLLDFTKKFFGNKKDDVPSEYESNFGNMLRKNISDLTKERRNELEKWKEKEHDK